MQQNFSDAVPAGMRFLVGSEEILQTMPARPAREPFAPAVLDFLQEVSRLLMTDPTSRQYPDVMTFAFWTRRASAQQLKKRFDRADGNLHIGRGLAFHVAPSNVPVNYAYSLAAGLLTGNANVVKVPSRDFPQISCINAAIQKVLEQPAHQDMRGAVCLVRYDRQKEINDWLSAHAAVRIVWGGDDTIAELRKSPLPPRAGEVAFADRFSLAVIDSDAYLAREDAPHIARDFYNDTYLTDQNACTSPRLVVWTGKQKETAKQRFWAELYGLVSREYSFQPIQGVNKLTSACLVAAAVPGVWVLPHDDNLLIRVHLPELKPGLMDLKDNSGYFFEYDCDDILDLRPLCDDTHCQTVAYIGDRELLRPLLCSGIKGIDRVVPVGQTMDFDLLWDGYDLYERLTRTVALR